MARFDFCGPSYQAQSLNADAQRTLNLYPEPGGPSSKSAWQMYNTPGLALFSVLPENNRSNGIYNAQGRFFAVAGSSLYEIFVDGTNTFLGALGNDGNAVSLVNSQNQLLVCSAGNMYLFKLNTNIWVGQVGADLGTVAQVEYSDGFFFARIKDSQAIYASDALDGTTWNPLSTTQVSLFPDNILAFKVSQRELFLLGQRNSVAYADVGASPFPFSPNLGSAMEHGIWAPNSLVRLDNTLFWLEQNERGSLVAVRLGGNGYNPVRISNFAVENAWQSYPVSSDAQAFVYEDRGHAFWVINFPSQNVTWTYDVATGMWHERGWLNPTTGTVERSLQFSHAFVFGMHMVGGRNSGNIYQQSIAFPDDDGYVIQRQRRAPHISTEQYRLRHSQLQIDLEAGQNPSIQALGGAVFTSIAVTPGSNLPFGNLGPLDILLVALKSDGSRYVASVTNQNNANDRQITITLPPVANFANWRIYFTPTGTQNWSLVTLPISGATAAYTYSAIAGGFFVFSATQVYTAIQAVPPGLTTLSLTPHLSLRWSDDGGHTWSNERILSVGAVGQYAFRCIAWQLGMSRDRVYEVTCTDPIAWRFIDAYLLADGFQAQERLSRQLAKQA